MDEDGALARGGDFKLLDEAAALDVVRGAFVVVVEADFAAGDDLGFGEQGVEFGEGGFVGFGGGVGIDARACVKARQAGAAFGARIELAADGERLVHLGRTLADADGEHCAHAGIPGAAEHGFAVVGVAVAV